MCTVKLYGKVNEKITHLSDLSTENQSDLIQFLENMERTQPYPAVENFLFAEPKATILKGNPAHFHWTHASDHCKQSTYHAIMRKIMDIYIDCRVNQKCERWRVAETNVIEELPRFLWMWFIKKEEQLKQTNERGHEIASVRALATMWKMRF